MKTRFIVLILLITTNSLALDLESFKKECHGSHSFFAEVDAENVAICDKVLIPNVNGSAKETINTAHIVLKKIKFAYCKNGQLEWKSDDTFFRTAMISYSGGSVDMNDTYLEAYGSLDGESENCVSKETPGEIMIRTKLFGSGTYIHSANYTKETKQLRVRHKIRKLISRIKNIDLVLQCH